MEKKKKKKKKWQPPKIELLLDKEDIPEAFLGSCVSGAVTPMCPTSTCSNGSS